MTTWIPASSRQAKEQVAAAIATLGVSPSVRGEALTLEQFAALANALSE